MRLPVYLLFFISGATGLAYEVLWSRYMGLFFGHSAEAQAVVLGVFLAGLALGNALFGRLADRATRPLALYGWLELGVGLCGLAAPFAVTLAGGLYEGLARGVGEAPGLLLVARLAIASALLLPGAALMGGTLPCLTRFVSPALGTLQRSLAGLYFLNSGGAAVGALLTGFVLVPRLGLDPAVLLAAITNALIGLVAVLLSARVAPPAATPAVGEEEAAYGVGDVRAVWAAIFVSGLISLVYEVAWTRLLVLVLGGSSFAFALMLAAFIAGISLGSLLVNRHVLPGRDAYRQLAWAELGIAGAILLTLPLYGQLPLYFMALSRAVGQAPGAWPLFQLAQFGVCFLLMLPPTVFIGMTLPLAARVVTRAGAEIGTRVGQVFAANTVGNVLGSLAAGFVLLPALGLRGVIGLGVAVNVALGAALFARVPGARRAAWAALPVAAVLLYLPLASTWDRSLLVDGVFRHHRGVDDARAFQAALAQVERVYDKDDVDGTVSVFKQGQELSLRVNGKADASAYGDLSTQVLLGQLPLLLAPKREHALVIGLGSGITAGSMLTEPLQGLDVVELSAAVIEASQLFAAHNHDVLRDPRTHLHHDDALGFLRTHDTRYDVVVSEPSNPWVAGVGNLFTREFYAMLKAHLAPGGVVGQWCHTYEMDDATLAMILRTFADAFGEVTLWQLNGSAPGGDLLILGRVAPGQPLPADLAARVAAPPVAAELRRIGLAELPLLLSLQLGSDATVRGLAGDGPLNLLRYPRLESQAPGAFFRDAVATQPYTLDERLRFTPTPALALPRWLAAEHRELTAAELASLHGFYAHTFRHPDLARGLLAAWLRLAPEDPRALAAKVAELHTAGELEAALALSERLPADAALLERRAALTLALANRSGGLLGLDPALVKRAFAAQDALGAHVPGRQGLAHRNSAELAFAAGQATEGLRWIARAEQAVAHEAGREAKLRELWMMGARGATRAGKDPEALAYLRQALQHDPENAEALFLASQLAARQRP
ncbi:MAG: speE2 [Cyanobacteria bacterium RYN_339]|nr:speE2 [Cyanobacteria bacterium RYN_339]